VAVKKLVLVSSTSDPRHKPFMQALEELAKALGVEKEVKEEDYVFLTDYGEKDEFGMPFLPQLFAVTDDGRTVPILTQIPFNKALQYDVEAAVKQALEKVKQL
jgi:hypothetical protein